MPTYLELLNDAKWNQKRKEILLRDNYECTSCQNVNILKNARGTVIGECVQHDDHTNLLLFNLCQIGKEYQRTGNFARAVAGWFNSKLTARWNNENFQKLNIPDDVVRSWENRPEVFFEQSNVYALYFETEQEPFVKVAALCNKAEGNLIIGYRNHLLINEELKKLEEGFKWYYVSGMQVHHTYYQEGFLPWEYPVESLKTLCRICHEEFHSNNKVPYYNSNSDKESDVTPCYKCDGWGVIPEYSHVEGGRCFACNGAKYVDDFGK